MISGMAWQTLEAVSINDGKDGFRKNLEYGEEKNMQTIVVKLFPEKLKNPDADLRYRVPDRIEEISDGRIRDNGYDYFDDGAMGIWLAVESAEEEYPVVLKLFREEMFLENDLSQSAEIYISEKDADDIENCTMVFPARR